MEFFGKPYKFPRSIVVEWATLLIHPNFVKLNSPKGYHMAYCMDHIKMRFHY